MSTFVFVTKCMITLTLHVVHGSIIYLNYIFFFFFYLLFSISPDNRRTIIISRIVLIIISIISEYIYHKPSIRSYNDKANKNDRCQWFLLIYCLFSFLAYSSQCLYVDYLLLYRSIWQITEVCICRYIHRKTLSRKKWVKYSSKLCE